MLLVKQRLARLVPGWVTQGSCSGADVGLARFTTDKKLKEKSDLFKKIIYTSKSPKDFSKLDLFSDIFTQKVGNVSTIKSEVFTTE